MLQERDRPNDPELHARRKWALKALGHAHSRLHFAGQVRGHTAVGSHADDAADALFVAGVLMEPYREPLQALAGRLDLAVDKIGHPSGEELVAVSAAAAEIERQIAAEDPTR